MGLFDVFKSKQQRETDAMVGKVLSQIFPNGEAEIVRDFERVRRLTKNKIPADKIRGYVRDARRDQSEPHGAEFYPKLQDPIGEPSC